MVHIAKERMPSLLGFTLICLDVLVYSQVPAEATTSYAPFRVQCPINKPLLRMAGSASQKTQTLSQEEKVFRKGRKLVTSSLWQKFFTDGPGKSTGYQNTPLMALNQNDWPVLGIAHSGGGERATLYGAGVLNALRVNFDPGYLEYALIFFLLNGNLFSDSETVSSPIRGVYQLASYSTGLSGGSWLVASMTAHNHPTIPNLLSRLQMDIDIILPKGSFYNSLPFFQNLLFVVLQKKLAGFTTSLVDHWSIALGQHFLPAVTTDNFYSHSSTTPRGAGITFSSFRNTSSIRDFQKPLPIIVSNHLPLVDADVNPTKLPIQGTTYVPFSAPIYEYSPFEFGSFDPQLSAFIPTEYLGTSLDSGKPIAPSGGFFSSFLYGVGNNCVRGFDQLSFIMGSSAALSNTLVGGAIPDFPSAYTAVINYFTGGLADKQPMVAHYPNPFKGLNSKMGFDRSTSDELLIVDGGENGENIPFNPLLAPARQVDVIIAADASADTYSNHPNGTAMINTWLRTHKVLPLGAANFPPVPLQPQVWINQGLNTRPTFFGCNASSTQENGGYPLVIYLPNSPLSPSATNPSTFKFQFFNRDRDLFVNSVTNSTTSPLFGPKKIVDSNWSTCLSCALIDRSRNRMNVPRSFACEQCFERYCYHDGVVQPTRQ